MERFTQHTPNGASLILGEPKSQAEAASILKVQFKRACNRLCELEDKLESGQLIEFPRITETVKGTEWAVEYLSETNIGSGIAKIYCGTREQAEAELRKLAEAAK